MSVTDGDPGLFHCTRLVELTVCKFKGLSSQPQAEFQLSPQKPLVRSNPGLRALTWHGRSVFKSLDLEDLARLENIEDLHLSSWDFENGLLPRLLRMHAGSLRTLHLELANNLNQGELSAPPLKRDNGKDDGTVIHEGYLTMDCLESLTVNAHTPNNQYLSELVRCCPALRELSVRLDEQDDTTLLARSLRNHCPKLDALILPNERLEDALVDLIKNSSARGFRKLHFSTRHGDSSSSPIPIVLLHAATLEDILIRQSYRCIDSQSVFRLFNECPKLKSISICLERNSQNCKDFLDVVTSQSWNCQYLERLELGWNLCSGAYCPKDARNLRQLSGEGPILGWYLSRQHNFKDERAASHMSTTRLLRILEVVQGLPHLKMLTVDRVVFTRTPERARWLGRSQSLR
ncbi:hypothetical protein BGX29_004143 [Mortierella sp. GBA35]|nr:hypothetical protein BGX29_004143 [Mortierella sp. GBA35]